MMEEPFLLDISYPCLFRKCRKLDFYQKLPQSREQAYEHALSLSVDAIDERNPNSYVSACESMLAHSEFALAENRDSRLVDLALAVLLDDIAPTNHVKLHPDAETDYRVNRLVAIANARRLRGEQSIARKRLSEAISILKKRDLHDKPQWWLDEQKEKLTRLESMLSKWKMPIQAQ